MSGQHGPWPGAGGEEEADRTTLRPGPPRPDEVGRWSGPAVNRSRLTDESLWERVPAPGQPAQPAQSRPLREPRPPGDTGARQPGRDRQQARSGSSATGGRERTRASSAQIGLIQLMVLVLVAGVVGLVSLGTRPKAGPPDTGRVAPRKAAAQFAKPVEQAQLPALSGGLRRDPARDEPEHPFGYVDRAHYQPGPEPTGPLFAAIMTSPVSSLNELDAHSGWANRNRFGAVSCGRADSRVECATLLRGGLLVVVAADPQADMGRVAAATSGIYRDLPG
ncbi:hypothetical protein CGZ93_12785 [Enemella dayhoffiae]|uniref:Uncharacterized protein n=1 Tax=Enemella dayhoffiae TaxID=2016507 RepID=A0A255GUA7_9ACTN|nr:hypothetical protein [Enemella dayhoffiae]OYO19258.1 hypothetical protein CGZ93_12785 [Enemella dayhoffiae]